MWHAGGVLKQLSFLDRFLPVWIIGAMGVGLLLGYFVPAVERAFNGVQIDSVSLPIAIGYIPPSSVASPSCSHSSSHNAQSPLQRGPFIASSFISCETLAD